MPRPVLVLIVAAAAMAPLISCTSEGTRGPAPVRTPSGTPTPPSAVPGLVARMSVREKVGQLFVPTFQTQAQAVAMIKRYHVGGFIYFPVNTRAPRQTAQLSNALQKTAKVPLLISVDEEQGLVTRLPYITHFPGNMALGATRSPGDVRAAARVTGAELRAVGINQDFSPVADVNVDPANPVIGTRSFGSDPDLAARLVGSAVDGFRDAGVAATAKHFPGHGDTSTDSHTGLPVIRHTRGEWEKVDAPPFRAAIAHHVDSIMSAHIVVRGLDDSGDPATLSPKVLTGVLRGDLGYQGVIITDSLQMAGVRRKYGDRGAPVRAIKAGADQLLMPPSLPKAYDAVLDAVQAGSIPKRRLDDAVTRVLRLKEQRGLFAGTAADPAAADAVIGSAQHRATARQVAEHSITLVKNEGRLLPLRAKSVYVTGTDAPSVAGALRRQGVRVVGTARSADVAVLTTRNTGAATAARVRALGTKPVIVAALGLPYDLRHAGGAKAALATYSAGSASVTALARVLTGSARPTGKLPVAIPKTYGFGHGLTYP
ncbi:glycoside hydrolase family 3 protein [Actinomadura sp. HBU206391]|uniref:glycoside hydrolase family 3 protein n=1 Tax=Actinomadura sp. HBU206391 TaxID=2731692 RepID=UPI0021C694B8|nr:glycoside hydrolase family 3 protein [Actinomadura sp. HBU206391]